MAPTIMVLAGGTGTSYHICKTIKEYYKHVRLVICDINPKHLVHSAVFADECITVPPIGTPGYEESMYTLFREHKVSVLIPIIDLDLRIFCSDNERLLQDGILSTAPTRRTFDTLSNKKTMYDYLRGIGVETPRLYTSEMVDPAEEYYIKDSIGFGSRGAYRAAGNQLRNLEEGKLIQELLFPPEITVDVFVHKGKVFSLCRERIEIKSGVSTKARTFTDKVIQKNLERIAESIELPVVTCVQFMTNNKKEWSLTDFNLRPGAGTAMSALVGFQCVRAALALWLGESIESLLQYPHEQKFIVRAYQEILTNGDNSI
jgi:carbamoylphosphate synthase large subunit